MPIGRLRTSTAAFAGWVAQGPTTPVLVHDAAEAAAVFGRDPRSVVDTALEPFFTCGGHDAWVVPLASGGEALVPDTAAHAAAFAAGAPLWAALDACEPLGLLVAPGATRAEVLAPLLRHAAARRLFVVADCPPGVDAAALAAGVPPALRGDDAPHGALYAPWLHLAPAVPAVMPPARPASGAVAGVLARIEETSGVWASPAGRTAALPGVVGLAQAFTQAEREQLNAAGINTIAQFPGMPDPVVWGGRTLASVATAEPARRYVNVRRFLLFLERSIGEGTRWVVFEPNEEPTWARARGEVEGFLLGLFRDGALFGRTPREAFFVRCDRTTMTQDDLDQGRLVCEIGVAPSTPAEFVVFRIGQRTAARPD